MPKKKRRLHSVQLHANRYLIWAIAACLIVAASLVAYIYISNIETDNLLIYQNVPFWHTYKDANMSFRYPAEWLIDPGDGYIGFGPKNQDLFLVYSYSPPNDPAYDSYKKLASAKPITVDGKEGIKIVDSTGQLTQKIAFVKTPKRLYEFRGTTLVFDQIISTVRFLK